MLNKIIATLLTVGGTGYINYVVAARLHAIEPVGDEKTSQKAYCIIWSIIDFAFFLFYQRVFLSWKLHGNTALIWTMLLTMATAFLLALLLAKPLQKLSYFLYNLVLKRCNESTIDGGSVWCDFFNGRGKLEAYCYDFQHNPVGHGFLTTYSMEKGNYDLVLQPFREKKHQPTYEEIIDMAQNSGNQEKQTIREYVNYDKQIIIFTFC